VTRAPRLLWFFCLALALLSRTLAAQEPFPGEYRKHVDVRLVLVPATVSTPEGQPVTNLNAEGFEVYENGQLRPLRLFEKKTELPLQLAMMLDASLSTAKDLAAEKAALARFIRRVLRPVDAASLYEFSGGARELTGFAAEAATLERALQKIRPRAGTALYDAIVQAAGRLREREGRRVLVLVTDGNDTSSDADFQRALRATQEAEASIFALIIRPIPGESGRSVRGEHALITLAELTGGRTFFVSRAAELDSFLDELNELLRTQYLLGYDPAPIGYRAEFRTIEVRVRNQDLVVRHRKGYYTEPQP